MRTRNIAILLLMLVVAVLYVLDRETARTNAAEIPMGDTVFSAELTLEHCANDPGSCLGGFVRWKNDSQHISVIVPSCTECLFQVGVVKFTKEENRESVLDKVDEIILFGSHAWQQTAIDYSKQFRSFPIRDDEKKQFISILPKPTSIQI